MGIIIIVFSNFILSVIVLTITTTIAFINYFMIEPNIVSYYFIILQDAIYFVDQLSHADWPVNHSIIVYSHHHTFFKPFLLFIYIIHIAIYGIHVTKQVTLKIQLEY